MILLLDSLKRDGQIDIRSIKIRNQNFGGNEHEKTCKCKCIDSSICHDTNKRNGCRTHINS